jgi:hypothetical protein
VIADTCPVRTECVPGPQSVHTESPELPPYFPCGQVTQTVAPVLPTNVPGLHNVQKDSPLKEYLPLSQNVHAASDVALAAAENLPAPQRLQTDTPTALNRPVPQFVHADAPALPANLPATQLLHAVAPPVEIEPAPQSAHVDAPRLPTNLPAVQLLHAAAPAVELEPAAHAPHVEAPAALNFPAPQFSHSRISDMVQVPVIPWAGDPTPFITSRSSTISEPRVAVSNGIAKTSGLLGK